MKKKTILTILLIVLVSLVVFTSIYTMVSYDLRSEYEKENDKYNIKIDYDESKVEELDDKIQDLIKEERTSYINEVNSINKEQEKKYQLAIDGSLKAYNELYFYHLTVNNVIKENTQNSKEEFYIYDNKSKEFTTIKNMLKDDKAFTDLSLVTKHLLNVYYKEYKTKFKTEKILESVKPLEENYENIYMDKTGLSILFSPYKLSNIQEGEIKITIPWNKTDDLLKEEYKKEKTSVKIERKTRDISKYKNSKVIAFTFDDGPNTPTTKILLDNLDKYDAKVTFFVLGNRVDNNKDIMKKAYQEGNDIASHTYSHKDLTTLKDRNLKKEVERTNKKIKKVIGVEPVYLRPPYGSINDHVREQMIMHTICWNIDSLDWKTKNRKKIKKEIVSHAEDGSVVLLHDIYKESVYGALLAMKELKKKGYNFVTITEMAELKNVDLGYDKTYYGF